jgi:hypothetical protein
MWRVFVLAGVLLVSFQALLYHTHQSGEPPPPWVIYRSGLTLYKAEFDGTKPEFMLVNATMNGPASWCPDKQWLWAGNHLYHYNDLLTLKFENSKFDLDLPEVANGWSPDGRYLLYEKYVETQDIYRFDVEEGTVENITQGKGYNIFVDWSPDKSWLLIEREGERNTGGFFRLEDTVAKQILPDEYRGAFQGWSPDGQWFYFWDVFRGNRDLFSATLDGSKIQQITETRGADGLETWSPDAKWIIISTWNDGLGELYRARPDGSDMQRITEKPSYIQNIRWAGDWLFFSMGTDYFNLDTYRMHPDGTDVEFLGDIAETELVIGVMNNQVLVYFSDSSSGITEGIAIIDLESLAWNPLTPTDSVSYLWGWQGEGFYYITRPPGINNDWDLHYTSLDGETQYTIANSSESDTFVATIPFPKLHNQFSQMIAIGIGITLLGLALKIKSRLIRLFT